MLTADGRGGMFVPRLELEHAQANSAVAEIAHYDEFPGERHPMTRSRSCSTALGVRGGLAADSPGYPWMFGYRGPTLAELYGEAPARSRASSRTRWR